VRTVGDVLDLALVRILNCEIELVADHAADADPAGLGQAFVAGGDIDAVTIDVAIDVAAVLDDVAQIDSMRNSMRRSCGALPSRARRRSAPRRRRWRTRRTNPSPVVLTIRPRNGAPKPVIPEADRG
jgi:hypothetical protein